MSQNPMKFSRRRVLGAFAAAIGAGSVPVVLAAAASKEAHAHDAKGMESDAHQHHHEPVPAGIRRTEVPYKVPPVTLVREDGARVAFPGVLDDGRPVLLDFVFTSCTSICPVTSHVFSQFQDKLGKERDKVNMVSISIDPEFDTPKRMTEYAKKYNASPQWQHYTGTVAASITMQKAFDVYRGDKMNHFPVTFMRAAPGKPWVRMDGFVTPDELMQEYRKLIKGSA
ncbi:MAG: Cytochrome oxidase biosis protein Sco1/SenC/PrrC, putative copper metallochaperone [Betaproteobacteria bacterium]|nr:Cytochrome oxidase biosis protein Sco1/SenC/PrrC, putative copper metallochaperone [Betaproteobacteria bacterium]